MSMNLWEYIGDILRNTEKCPLEDGKTHKGYTIIFAKFVTIRGYFIECFAVKTENRDELVKACKNTHQSEKECADTFRKLAMEEKLFRLETTEDDCTTNPDGTVSIRM